MIEKNIEIAVIGLGYVGFPLLQSISHKFTCWGVDSDSSRIAHLKNTYPQLKVTSNWKDVKDCNFYIVAVPTPIDSNNNPDVSSLKIVCGDLAKVTNRGNIIVFESTVYPGATEEVCIPIIERLSGLKINQDFYVGYSPERINVGDVEHQLQNTSKIVSASHDKAYETIKNVYQSIISANILKASSIKVAEAAKMYENVQRDVLIALANEFSEYCRLEGINIEEVTKCASSKWNFASVNPGLVGGHCIAVDPYYLINRSIQKNIHLSLINNAREINEQKVFLVAKRIENLLLSQGYNLSSVKVLLLGITYKNDVSDCRNTKIPQIINLLKNNGINVYCYDPMASIEYICNNYQIELIPDNEFNIENYDFVIKMVNHQIFENQEFVDNTDYKLSDLL